MSSIIETDFISFEGKHKEKCRGRLKVRKQTGREEGYMVTEQTHSEMDTRTEGD